MGETAQLVLRDIISIPSCLMKLEPSYISPRKPGVGGSGGQDFFKINTRSPEFYSETLDGLGAKFSRGHSH